MSKVATEKGRALKEKKERGLSQLQYRKELVGVSSVAWRSAG